MWKILKSVRNIILRVEVTIVGIYNSFSFVRIIVIWYIQVFSPKILLDAERLNRKTGWLGCGTLGWEIIRAALQMARVLRMSPRGCPQHGPPPSWNIPEPRYPQRAWRVKLRLPHVTSARLRVSWIKHSFPLNNLVAFESWPHSLSHHVDFALTSSISRLTPGDITCMYRKGSVKKERR